MTEHIPEITVLLPAYNAGPYIKEAVDSVLSQTFKDFALLIINDGSKDNTREILESYTDPRITVIHQENMGLIKTLNKGLSIIKSPYIARFDADDVCYPQRLEEQYKFLKSHPDYVLIGSEADYMDEQGNHIFTYRFRQYEDEEIKAGGFELCPVIHASVTFLRQAVIDAGGYSDKAITFEDHLLWRNLGAYGKMKNVHHPLIKVRFNPDSVTIDEKWRGKEFIDLKQRSISSGYVSDADYELLKEILKKQNFIEYKRAAYHSMLGKKFLWNQHKPRLARQHLSKAISIMPFKMEPYMLYFLSFFPSAWIDAIYRSAKK